VKYTQKGQIKIYVYVEKQTGFEKYIRFQVEDSGLGINQKEIPYLFSLFGVNHINKQKKNVGLGLSISQVLA